MTESLSHLPPGRRAAVDALTNERFSRPLWWPTPPRHTDSQVMQYFRRIELEAEAADDEDEEVSDGSIEAPSV